MCLECVKSGPYCRFLFATKASTVSTKSVSTTGSLQRSRSDIDVNAAASAKSKVSAASGAAPFSSAAALPPGSYASLGNQTSHRSPCSAVPDASAQTYLCSKLPKTILEEILTVVGLIVKYK